MKCCKPLLAQVGDGGGRFANGSPDIPTYTVHTLEISQLSVCFENGSCYIFRGSFSFWIFVFKSTGLSVTVTVVSESVVPTTRCGTQGRGALCVCVRLTMAAQVYGGSMSFVVSAYLWCVPLCGLARVGGV